VRLRKEWKVRGIMHDYYRVMIKIPSETRRLITGKDGHYWEKGTRWITWVCEETLIDALNARDDILEGMTVLGTQIINPFNVDEFAELRYTQLMALSQP
jgi:hypothetical protein